MGIGFTLTLAVLGAVREFLGTGQIWGVELFNGDYAPAAMGMPVGAFVALGLMLAIINKVSKS
jgi:electron transport complex protein RnfE